MLLNSFAYLRLAMLDVRFGLRQLRLQFGHLLGSFRRPALRSVRLWGARVLRKVEWAAQRARSLSGVSHSSHTFDVAHQHDSLLGKTTLMRAEGQRPPALADQLLP